METAARNGFTAESMGCPIIISDGMYGTDDVKIDIPDGVLLKEAYMAKGIADADSMIVVSHFKGHGSGVYGGSIKNIAIGCSSKRGKFNVHICKHQAVGWDKLEVHRGQLHRRRMPQTASSATMCASQAPSKIKEDHAEFDPEKCIGCFGHQRQLFSCKLWESERFEDWRTWFLVAMGDAATAYLRHMGKDRVGYLTYAVDIAPACDCVPGSDRPVIPNLGVFASRDMVSIDMAALDMSVKMPGIHGSAAEDKHAMNPGDEKFTAIVGMSQWITPNTCSVLGLRLKRIRANRATGRRRMRHPSVHPMFSPEKTSGHYLAKGMKKFGTWTPPGGYKYHDKPKVSVEELSKR